MDEVEPSTETQQAARNKKKDEIDEKITRAVQQLPQTWVKSPTVVVEAAIFLIQEGVFKIPDLGIQNVKQCRAFLLTAIWFQ